LPKGFQDHEKQEIEQQLIEVGKEFFSTFGLKKTSIAQLTEAVGIAQGSFYIFFSSKEELYFHVLEKEEELLKQKLFNDLNQEPMTAAKFQQFLLKAIQYVEQNSFMKRIYLTNELELIMRKLPKEKIQEHIQKDEKELLPLIQKWQQEGVMINEDPKVITALIRTFMTITIHKREIGEDMYERTVELLADSIATKLFEG